MGIIKKKNGRPPRIEREPDEIRHIPLRMRHREAQQLDRASELDNESRTKWCHRTLMTAADARIKRAKRVTEKKRAERRSETNAK